MNDDERLDKMMDRWDSEFTPDPSLLSNVRSQARTIRAEEARRSSLETDSLGDWLRMLLARPAFALGYAAVFAFVGIGISSLLIQGVSSKPEEFTLSYRLSIDPLYRLEAVAGSRKAQNRDERAAVMHNGLDWLQNELKLSSGQFERVSKLHTGYEQAFDEVFLGLMESHAEYRELDKRRMSNDVVDYMYLFELLQTQKRLSEESSKLTYELLKKVSEVITPDQQERYDQLIENLYPNAPSKSEPSTNA